MQYEVMYLGSWLLLLVLAASSQVRFSRHLYKSCKRAVIVSPQVNLLSVKPAVFTFNHSVLTL